MSDKDQYHTLLRAMDEGLIISLNNSQNHAIPSRELVVESSKDDKTEVLARESGEQYYKIHRNRRDNLVYSELTEDGLSLEDEVITIEVLGLE